MNIEDFDQGFDAALAIVKKQYENAVESEDVARYRLQDLIGKLLLKKSNFKLGVERRE